jgi:hypothetical protein
MQEQKALFFNFFIDFSSLNGIHYFGHIHPLPVCCLAGGILRYSVKQQLPIVSLLIFLMKSISITSGEIF